MYIYEITFMQVTEYRERLAEEARRQRLAAGLRGGRRARVLGGARVLGRRRGQHVRRTAAREAAAPS